MHLNRHDTGSTTARSVDEVALIRDTISHYAPVLIAPLSNPKSSRRRPEKIRARAFPRKTQNLGQRIGKSSWLRELENISVGHGVSLLCWRSGGLEHPHDTPPYPFTPSPTF